MKLTIEYCLLCNYRPIAAALAVAIEKGTGLKSELVPSRDAGALEVKLNEELIFSKKQTDRFPTPSEIVEILNKKK